MGIRVIQEVSFVPFLGDVYDVGQWANRNQVAAIDAHEIRGEACRGGKQWLRDLMLI